MYTRDPFSMGFLVRGFTVLFAVGVFGIAYVAWRRNKRNMLLFVALAFAAYSIRGMIRFAEIATPDSISPLLVSLSDLLDLATLLMIFFAVVKE